MSSYQTLSSSKQSQHAQVLLTWVTVAALVEDLYPMLSALLLRWRGEKNS